MTEELREDDGDVFGMIDVLSCGPDVMVEMLGTWIKSWMIERLMKLIASDCLNCCVDLAFDLLRGVFLHMYSHNE